MVLSFLAGRKDFLRRWAIGWWFVHGDRSQSERRPRSTKDVRL
nr:hypothetical protein [Kibdelosporangium sp. MJ126-NF4]